MGANPVRDLESPRTAQERKAREQRRVEKEKQKETKERHHRMKEQQREERMKTNEAICKALKPRERPWLMPLPLQLNPATILEHVCSRTDQV